MTSQQSEKSEQHESRGEDSPGRGWMVTLVALTIVGIIVWLVIARGEDTV